MSKRVGVFGTSGFAREVGDIVMSLGWDPVFIARDSEEESVWNFEGDVILEAHIERYRDMGFIIGIGENAVREKIARKYTRIIDFINIIHPGATFGYGQQDLIARKKGIVICAGVRLTNNIDVGNFSIINLNSTVGHDVVIDDFVNIAPGANISGNVHIGSRCWIGTGAVVNQGSSSQKLFIGADTVVGSGAVVIKSCDENSTYVGAPARRIK